jgi:acyl homoserine lactone synthase
MIVVIEPFNAHKYSNLMDKMFELRARIFHARKRWDVKVVGGRERDKFDDLGPVYVLYTDEEMSEVKGSLRLLPTTGPTLLSEFFADCVSDAAALSAPAIWECSRLCIDEKIAAAGYDKILHATAVMLDAVGNVAVKAGIETIVGNFDAPTLRLYRRIGCELEIVGHTLRYGKPIYLGLHHVSEDIVRRLETKYEEANAATDVVPSGKASASVQTDLTYPLPLARDGKVDPRTRVGP